MNPDISDVIEGLLFSSRGDLYSYLERVGIDQGCREGWIQRDPFVFRIFHGVIYSAVLRLGEQPDGSYFLPDSAVVLLRATAENLVKEYVLSKRCDPDEV